MSNDSTDLHPGMMGDGTEEQNLGQTGNPKARITEEEVDEAFAAPSPEPRAFTVDDIEDTVEDFVEDVEDETKDLLAALAEKVDAVREQVQESVEVARAWAARQADVAVQTASQKPVLVVSASAGAALALGLAVGFILGRATADD